MPFPSTSAAASCVLPIGQESSLVPLKVADGRWEFVTARAAYEDFFALWKNADPDVPILAQAKAEYAKLQ